MMMPCQIDQQKVQQQGTASNSEDGRIAEQTGNSGAKQRAKYGAGRLKWLIIAEDPAKSLGWHFQGQNCLGSRHQSRVGKPKQKAPER